MTNSKNEPMEGRRFGVFGLMARRLAGVLSTAVTAVLVSTVVVYAVSALPNAGHVARARGVRACVGTDGVLRGGRTQGCVPTDLQLVLALSAFNAAMPASSSSFVDLKRRVDRLGDTPSFQVVDHGRVVFSVSPSHVQLNGPNERPAVELNASVNGGLVTTESIDGTAQISVGITTNHAGVVMYKDGVARVDLGRRPWGGYALRFLSASEELVAGIGDSVDRSGALSLADAEGRLRSTVTAKKVGSFNVNSHAGAAIVSFRRSQIGAGLLSIGNADGREAIKMAVNGNRYGAVIAGPRVGFPLMRGSGLPGSYILGCAAGPACVPR